LGTLEQQVLFPKMKKILDERAASDVAPAESLLLRQMDDFIFFSEDPAEAMVASLVCFSFLLRA